MRVTKAWKQPKFKANVKVHLLNTNKVTMVGET